MGIPSRSPQSRTPLAALLVATAFALALSLGPARGQVLAAPSIEDPAPPPGVRCGLGKAFHAGRRAALREAVGEGWLVFRGLPDTRAYEAFHQDKTFWYLTGVESPNAALVMRAQTGAEVLFLPRPNRRQEAWEGELWDSADAWVPPLVGIEDVRPADELEEFLREHVTEGERVWVSLHPHVALAGCFDRAGPFDRRRARDPFDGRPSREQRLADWLREELGADVADCAPQLADLRRIKTPEEIAAMRRAARVGAEAMNEAIRSTRPGLGEGELAALMEMVMKRLGAAGHGYHAIVGAGENSLVLHYSANRGTLDPGEVVLVDYGPEVDHYVCDITRTWPVDETFSPRMRELYQAVYDAQEAAFAAARPGATLAEVDRAAKRVLEERGLGKWIRHGTCHWIGLEVHDVGAYDAPLAPGCAFTIEPGVYESETGIGIRIEETVVITEDGCEVLTAGCPRSIEQIEALIAAEGVFDRIDRSAKEGAAETR